MEREIEEQPDVLASNASRYRDELSQLAGESFEMCWMAARGSSDHAALYARYLIEIHLHIPVSLSAPSVLTRYGSRVRYPKCLAIGISQSGAAPDVAEVLAAMSAAGHKTLAITNTPHSHLSKVANQTLLLEAGEEKSIAATKTYTASLLALYQLVDALGGNLPSIEHNLPTRETSETARHAAEESLGLVLRSSSLFALARGYSFCTAQEAALKLMECALLPCKSYSSADFQHGPRALASHGTAILSFGADVEGLAKQGAAIIGAPVFKVPEPLCPLSEILFGQWLALLASKARGLDPDNAPHILKVTQTL